LKSLERWGVFFDGGGRVRVAKGWLLYTHSMGNAA